MLDQKKHKTKVVFGLAICCIFSALSLLAILNRQHIVDQIVVWQFKATSDVTVLVDRAGMNDYGKFLYLASEPSLNASQEFNAQCQYTEAVVSILGCFKYGRIYIYDVTDKQLDGVRETTAAHETLHAAYVRMGDDEKNRLGVLLDVIYKKLEADEQFKDLMAFYATTEPGQRNNELHSIIGTEVSDIGPELEAHYSKYFSDRQKVIALNNKYKNVFKVLDDRAEAIRVELRNLSNDVTLNVEKYNSDIIVLNSDIIAFNSKTKNGGFATEAQFYDARNYLVGRINGLDATRVSIQADIDKYDTLLKEYNAISTESRKLNNSINSTLAPAPSV